MSETISFSPEFEDEIRAILAVPDANPAYVAALRSKILSQNTQSVRKAARLRLAWAVPLLVLFLLAGVILAVGPQRVLAAVQSWFGYVPGLGFVQDSDLRMVEAPVSLEHDGVSLTVEQGLADAERTILRYTVEGVAADPAVGEATACLSQPYLRLEDGTVLAMTGGDGNGWPSGYQSRSAFLAVPAGIDTFWLVIPCPNDTVPLDPARALAVQLHLVPAPEDYEILPLIALSTSQPTLMPEPEEGEIVTIVPTTQPEVQGIVLSVQSMAETETGYLFQGKLSWRDSEYGMLLFDPYALAATVNGEDVPLEPADVNPDMQVGEREAPWAVQTNRKFPNETLTFSLSSLQAWVPVEVTFDLDLGNDPQLGQTWELNQELEVAGNTLHIPSVSLQEGRNGAYQLTFILEMDRTRLADINLYDPDNRSDTRGGGGGADDGVTIERHIVYDQIPQGVRHIQINLATVVLAGPWTGEVTLPASSMPAVEPTAQTQTCISGESLLSLENESATTLPEGLGGRLLVEGPAAAGMTFPTLYVINLDGTGKIEIGPGGWESLSPDGSKVAFVRGDGMHVFDIASGQDTLLSWATTMDYHPLWSPDGTHLAFVRSTDGIYTSGLNGSDLRRVTGSTANMSLAGWMPDGTHIVVTALGAEGAQVQIIEIESGAVQSTFIIDNRKGGFPLLSPDGAQIAFNEIVFGEPAYGVYLANLDGNAKRLLAAAGEINVSPAAFSPDSRWMLVSLNETTQSTAVLIELDTCRVVFLPDIQDKVTGWR